MLPKLVARRLEVINATQSGGRWVLDHLLVASIRVSALSSGLDDDPYVKFVVDWGDGTTETSDFLPVNRDFSYSHAYDTSGEFFIRVRAINSSGAVSSASPNDVATLQVLPQVERQAALRRWGGLGLPVEKLATTAVATQDAFPSTSHTLATKFEAGSFEVILSGGITVESNAEITVWQPGRLVTFGRVVKDLGNGKFLLSVPAQDTYDVGTANAELRRRSYSTERVLEGALDPGWAFPVTYDIDLVRSSLIMLLETRPGERLMRPWVGSRLPELVFEQSTPLLDQMAAAYITDAIAPEPRLALGAIRVEDTTENGRRVLIESSLANASEQVFEASIPLSVNSELR